MSKCTLLQLALFIVQIGVFVVFASQGVNLLDTPLLFVALYSGFLLVDGLAWLQGRESIKHPLHSRK